MNGMFLAFYLVSSLVRRHFDHTIRLAKSTLNPWMCYSVDKDRNKVGSLD